MIDPQIQEELKAKLLEEKTRIEKTLAPTEANEAGVDKEYETKFPDVDRDEEANADEMDMYESNLAADEALKGELEKIEKSLAAIDAGTYGICANCQKEIPLERLRAYPQADTCLECNGK
ncbi:MAG TPA: TraR/DksA C4-type zinc finger protein [Candidatus Bathyarchaeia archaeon]|nr:TraR/DksA C4-type zinc finger protein [Candidatus Bathyarchaeia archaeon]